MTSGADLIAAKRALRRQMRARLATISGAAWRRAGADVARHLDALWPPSGTVALFASRGDELSTETLDASARARGLTRLAPRVVGDALEFVRVDDDVALKALPPDRWGIPTPPAGLVLPLQTCALVIVPGLAFDVWGGRLGHGRGFYDRALMHIDDDVIVGVLHPAQWVEAVPQEPWDRRLTRLVSPEGVVTATPRR